ncbi:hypothetical protein [Methyloglobulus sp.]|uniref:hypothetical protein n=1 Tax=Methyloglobulus sp. TaxID=2518622 RepID=UPI0032B7EBF7
MSSPYVLALGTQIKNRQDGVVLDFSGSANLTLTCSIHFTSVDTCIKESIIHEFGHVIGISHEQNSNDTLPGGGCSDVASVNNKKDALV